MGRLVEVTLGHHDPSDRDIERFRDGDPESLPVGPTILQSSAVRKQATGR